MATAEAQKVLRAPESKPGAQEMSANIARAVDSILDILRGVPPAYRLQVLRIAESKIRPSIVESGELVRKVNRWGRAFAIAMPVRFGNIVGEYAIQIRDNALIYERVESGEVRVRKSGTAIRIPIPKWAYEAIGSPAYVRVRVEGSRIVVEPA